MALPRRSVLGAVASAALAPVALAAADRPDPVLAAIRAAREADAAFSAALVGLDEDDAARMAAADRVADASTAALDALAAIRPTTPAGLLALARFYAEDAERGEPYSLGALNLRRLLAVMEPRPAPD